MDRPPVFADESFATALEKTRSSTRLLIVDASAEWCGPCKQMDRTTWRNLEVVSWFEANATAIQIDVDQEKEWAQAHRISAMPTLIAFKDGAEYDRIVGGKQPRDLLDWLDGLLRGETVIGRLRALAGEGGTDVEKRYELARGLLSDGKLAEATSEFAWLWEHMNEFNPGMTGVRVSYMAGDIETLVAQDELARSRFRAIRDRTALRADLDGEARFDWIVLNEMLREVDATLAWFDQVAAGGSAGSLDMKHLADRLIPLLLSRDRWADAARLIEDGGNDLVRHHEMSVAHELPSDFDEEMGKQIKEMGILSFRQKAAQTRHMLVAANRTEEAADVERKALALDPSDEMKAWLARPRDQVLDGR